MVDSKLEKESGFPDEPSAKLFAPSIKPL